MRKFGIDISKWQGDFNMSLAKQQGVEFVVIKAAGGDVGLYTDAQFENNYRKAKANGLPVGAYFYSQAYSEAAAKEEANYLIKLLKGKQFELPIYYDIEDAGQKSLGKSKLTAIIHAFCQTLEANGYWAGIYSSLSWFQNYMNDAELQRYSHWVAQWSTQCTYPNSYGMWQFGGETNLIRSNIIAGQTVDQNYMYEDYPAKIKAAGANGFGKSGKQEEKQVARIDCADVAARIHADMCDDNDNGYSWTPRQGEDGAGVKTLVIDGREYSYDRGSWDCSSSVIKAWQEAIKYTKYKGALDGASYTGNMRSVFANSGLFEVWDTQSTCAVRGDVYLNDATHTAMCQDGGSDGVYGYDALSEFCISENGDVYNNQTGDQTGVEAYVHGFYGVWDCTLHYNGNADEEGSEPAPAPTPTPEPSGDCAVYNAMVGGEWLDTMNDLYDTGGSGDDYAGILGQPMGYFACDMGKYRVYSAANGWLPWVDKRDLNDLEYGAAGDGSAILKIEIPSEHAHYQAHTQASGWLPWMKGNYDEGGSSDTFAGDGTPIDAIRLERV